MKDRECRAAARIVILKDAHYTAALMRWNDNILASNTRLC
jgi:hypothetical protein